jgi:hypothetical protein
VTALVVLMRVHQGVRKGYEPVISVKRCDISGTENIPERFVPAGEYVKSCTEKSGPSKGCTIRTRISGITPLRRTLGEAGSVRPRPA